jgi:hypothetical protein
MSGDGQCSGHGRIANNFDHLGTAVDKTLLLQHLDCHLPYPGSMECGQLAKRYLSYPPAKSKI